MEFFSIASGSSGNCICTGNDDTHILLDAGISGKRIEEGLNTYDLGGTDMAGIFVTHEHSDHIAGLGVLARRYGLPIYATKGTVKKIKESKSVGKIDAGLFHIVTPGKDVSVGSLTVRPVRTSHDAADPCAYTVRDAKHKVSVITDLGCYTDQIVEELTGTDILLLEANHDVNMLTAGSYPYPLKRRILSEFGHLSNETAGQLLCRILHEKLRHIFLGHLSKENNFPDLAYETVSLEVTLGDNPYKGKELPIEVAARDTVSKKVTI